MLILQPINQRLENLGRPVVRFVMLSVAIIAMVFEAIDDFRKETGHARRTIRSILGAQTYFTGWQAMPLITLLAIVTGSVIILNTGGGFNPFGSGTMTGQLLYLIVVKELGPLIVALVVIARSGTAVASELGNMKANREWDALKVMGINPLTYIIFPRLLAGIISIWALCFNFDVIAILGGYAMTYLLHTMPFGWFIDSVMQNITFAGLILVFVKNAVIAVVIFSVSCYQGITVKQSHHEVPQVTTKAVVISIVTVTLINFSFSAVALWWGGWKV